MASRSRRLYIGVTNANARRVLAHRCGEVAFTAKYRITRLVHVETMSTALEAIAREKQLKGWRRSKKVALIESTNPTWVDLAAEWKLVQDADVRQQRVPPPSLRSGSG